MTKQVIYQSKWGHRDDTSLENVSSSGSSFGSSYGGGAIRRDLTIDSVIKRRQKPTFPTGGSGWALAVIAATT